MSQSMSDIKPLNPGQKNLLRLVVQGMDAEGWAPVSKAVYPLLEQMPAALIELQRVGDAGRGRVRLTEEGHTVINVMPWFGA